MFLEGKITNKIHNCPNCTANNFKKTTIQGLVDSNMDVLCKGCKTSYKLVLKYPPRKVNKAVIELIGRASICSVSKEYNVDPKILLAFSNNASFYDSSMYKFITDLFQIDTKEATSFLPVTVEKYNEILKEEEAYWKL